jgi:hypothetical protein
VVVGAVLLSRLPVLGPGYGLDPDAWNVAAVARFIGTTGQYAASRFPGYPVHEFLSALLWHGGPLALTGATALMSALAAGFFALILRRLGGRDHLLAACAMASVPAFYLASVQALDFAWGLAFALAALYLALRGRPGWAGVLAGLAIGCRITQGIWLVPLSFVVVEERPRGGRIRALLALGSSALLVGALAFLPAGLRYGLGFLRFYEHGYTAALIVVKNASTDLWGIPGVLALAFAIPLALGRRSRQCAVPRAGRGLLLGSGIALLLFFGVFLRLPHEADYLVPAIPLTLLLLGTRLERGIFIALCAALMVSPWLIKVSQPAEARGTTSGPGAVTVRVSGHPLIVDWLQGPLLTARARALRNARYVDQVLESARGMRVETVVAAGNWLAQIRVRTGGTALGEVRFVPLLTAAELRELRARRVPVYYLAAVDWTNEVTNGVSLRENGARPLMAGD